MKEAEEEKKKKHYPQRALASLRRQLDRAQSSVCLGPRQTSVTASASGANTKKGLSSNIAASPSSLSSSTFSASPRAENPD